MNLITTAQLYRDPASVVAALVQHLPDLRHRAGGGAGYVHHYPGAGPPVAGLYTPRAVIEYLSTRGVAICGPRVLHAPAASTPSWRFLATFLLSRPDLLPPEVAP